MSDLYARIYATVRTIPYGEIASYSQVARAVGLPRGARIVGWALGVLPPQEAETTPWWRVVNAQRVLSMVNPRVSAEEQARRLRSEGHEVTQQPGVFLVAGDAWWQPPVS